MTVRLKTLATVCVTLVALIVVMQLGTSRVLNHSFDEVEQRDTHQNIRRVIDALENEHSKIALVAADWAPWEDTYEFVLHPNPAYAEENFGDDSLSNLGNDLMVYAQLNGRITWSTGYQPEARRRTPMPRGFAPWVRPGSPLQHQRQSLHPVRGLINLPDGPMLVVSHPILKNDRTGPARGALILGRWLDRARIAQISRLTHLHVSIQRYNSQALPVGFAQARVALARGETYTRPLDENTMAGYALLRDINGRPSLILQVCSPRDDYRQGQRTTSALLLALVIMGVVFLGVLFLMLERVVIRPILRLSQDVGSVQAGGAASQRVHVQGNDEVTRLAMAVNDMLESLERSHRKQIRSEALFRQMALNASDALFTMDPDSGSLTWFGDIAGLLGFEAIDQPETTAAWLRLVHPDDREAGLEAIHASRASGEALRIETRIRHADGTWRVVAIRGKWLQVDDTAEGGAGGKLIGACADITERKQREEALQASEERLARIVETNADAILLLDRDRHVTLANAAVEAIFGISRDDILNETVSPAAWEMSSADGRPLDGEDCPFLQVIRSRRPVRDAEFSVCHATGRRILVSINAAPLLNAAGEVTGVAVSVCDISERKTLEERLTYQAYHDSLTNLPNRALFHDRLNKALARCQRTGKGVGVLFLDLDNFKLINDSLGHGMGDHLLVQVARRLENSLRESDTAARFGGDEFTVMFEDISCLEDARALAGRVLDRMQRPFLLGTREVYVTPSIGIAISGLGNNQPDELLRNADAAMYEAKSNGKARIEVFHSSLNTHALTRLEMENDLRRALERGELEVHYQPKVAIEGGEVMSLEALVRWRHPRSGLIMPGQFVPLAEQTSLIVPIGRFVLNEACRAAHEWQRNSTRQTPISVSVNLSARQFQHPELIPDVARALRDHDLNPHCLILEITESVLMDEAEATIKTLNDLKNLGVRLAIDDFGTGYSSLSYLKRFPMDFVKIDRSFVSGLGSDSEDTVIVSATVSLAHALGLTVVAEGAETTAQVEHLRSIGCDLAQGFWFAHAMQAADVPGYLRDHMGLHAPDPVPDLIPATGAA